MKFQRNKREDKEETRAQSKVTGHDSPLPLFKAASPGSRDLLTGPEGQARPSKPATASLTMFRPDEAPLLPSRRFPRRRGHLGANGSARTRADDVTGPKARAREASGSARVTLLR